MSDQNQMSDQLLIALLNAVAKEGFAAVFAFMSNKGATTDQAIAALEIAASKSLAQIKAEELAKLNKTP